MQASGKAGTIKLKRGRIRSKEKNMAPSVKETGRMWKDFRCQAGGRVPAPGFLDSIVKQKGGKKQKNHVSGGQGRKRTSKISDRGTILGKGGGGNDRRKKKSARKMMGQTVDAGFLSRKKVISPAEKRR